MPCATCRRYVDDSIDAHGFPRTSIRAGWKPDDGGAWPELDELSLPELSLVAEGRVPLGRLVDVPVKWFLMDATLASDPLGPVTLRRFLRSARRVAKGIDRALDEIRPDVVLLLNGLFFFEAIAWELCQQRGIDVRLGRSRVRPQRKRASAERAFVVVQVRNRRCKGECWPRSR